jgi:lipoprotein-anchoring transpeptidase ErfK/SrfK
MFNHVKVSSIAACAILLLACGLVPNLAVAGPYVVRGAVPEDPSVQPGQNVTPVAATTYGQYGGGFIEMLVTVGQSAPSASYQPQPSERQVAAYSPPAQTLDVRRKIDPIYMRTEVDYSGKERPGSIIVDTSNKFLYLVTGGGRAIRYGIGVGRPGFEWSGVKTVNRKAEWPDWTPPKEMLARRPDLPRRMVGGPDNPLGARALYLGSSLYRIHGTNEPFTIGQNVSSGCIRMMNDDVVDLYNRVSLGARVVVR